MGKFFRPYDAGRGLMSGCGCGLHRDQAQHDADSASVAPDQLSNEFVEATLVKALFPQDAVRRAFIKAVGVDTARAAIASVLPIASLQAMAQEKRPLEKGELKIGFIAITCATPLIMADPLGFYKRQGLKVQLNKTAGWALIRDKMLNREHDASHFLSPMPVAISMGLGSIAQPMRVATIQNINGQAITLHAKHKDKRDPKEWKGFRFAVPFEYSMHNFLLRYYVAEHGLDPDKDIQIRVTPPPEMVANLRAGNIDGFLGPDPFNQRAVFDEVGFIHLLSKEIWNGHPCCAFGMTEAFIKEAPNTYAALYRAVLEAAAMAREARNRELGLAGEEFVLRFERARLLAAGRARLAEKIVHVSKERGDGEGFDVLSFEESGEERLIEVKTTKYGRHTPFFLSRNEVAVSERKSDQYQLYRLFEFGEGTKLFGLAGALSQTCTLEPTSFVGVVAR